jgi:rubrerythrin
MDAKRVLAAVQGMPLGEVYSFAIERERDAQAFYKSAQSVVNDPGAQAMLADLYGQEVGHERLLTRARDEGKFDFVGQPRGFADLGLADLLPEVKIGPQSAPQDVLTAAIKKEAFAEAFYRAAESSVADPNARSLFAHLSSEERQHKNQLETWYDDHILTNN